MVEKKVPAKAKLKKKPKKNNLLAINIFLSILLLVFIIGGVFFWFVWKDAQENQEGLRGEINNLTGQVSNLQQTNKELSEKEKSLKEKIEEFDYSKFEEQNSVWYKKEYEDKNDWEFKKLFFVSNNGAKYEVPQDIAMLVDRDVYKNGKQGQVINSYVMPVSTSDRNIIFFSTVDVSTTTKDETEVYRSINRVYIYHLKDRGLSEVFKEEAEANSPLSENTFIYGRTLRTAGIDGGNLLLLIDDPEKPLGECSGIWSGYSERFVYFDINDPKQLTPYTVPRLKIESDKEEMKSCK